MCPSAATMTTLHRRHVGSLTASDVDKCSMFGLLPDVTWLWLTLTSPTNS